jgi:hypothetical protein
MHRLLRYTKYALPSEFKKIGEYIESPDQLLLTALRCTSRSKEVTSEMRVRPWLVFASLIRMAGVLQVEQHMAVRYVLGASLLEHYNHDAIKRFLQDYRTTIENENAKHGLGPGHNPAKAGGRADAIKRFKETALEPAVLGIQTSETYMMPAMINCMNLPPHLSART